MNELLHARKISLKKEKKKEEDMRGNIECVL
jgi:hypothetical protein